jgi:PAS domain S-box-containing protein
MDPAIQQSAPARAAALRRFSCWTALFVALVATTILWSWFTGIPLFKNLRPQDPRMSLVTALTLVLISLGSVLSARRPQMARLLGFLSLGISIASFSLWIHRSEYPRLLGFFAEDPFSAGALPQTLPTPFASLGMAFLSVGILNFAAPRLRFASQLSALLGCGVGVLALTGYIVGAAPPHGLALSGGMALPTCLILILLGMAIACLTAETGPLKILLSDTDVGRIAIWMLPGSVALPLAIEALKLFGTQKGWYSGTLGDALYALLTSCVFLMGVWLAAIWLDRLQTERFQAEDAARLSDTRFRRLIDSNILGVVTANAQGAIIQANDAFLKMMGYSREEMESGELRWVHHPLHIELRRATHNWAIPVELDAATPREEELVRKDGSRLPVLAGFARLEEGGAFIAFLLDISQRKRAETERDHFFTLSLDLLCIADADGYFRRLNPAFERTLGYTQAELMEKPFLHFIHPDDVADTETVLRQLEEGRKTMGFENRYVCKDGSARWLLWSAAPGPNRLIYATARDITERKRAEEELRRTAAELARSNAELEQFAYLASHDLQEPLRAVAGCAQILERKYREQLNAQGVELIQFIVDGASRMKSLITDMLAYSRVGRAGKELRMVPSEASLVAALANLRASIEERGARITHTPLPEVFGDALLLTQLFQNLLGNALKFCTNHPPEVHVTANHQESEWRFSVRDNGIGIDPQHFQRIFGVFQRLHTRREFEGTGIGLAVCKKIVECHGGKISLESAPGQGTTFYFTIPDPPPTYQK